MVTTCQCHLPVSLNPHRLPCSSRPRATTDLALAIPRQATPTPTRWPPTSLPCPQASFKSLVHWCTGPPAVRQVPPSYRAIGCHCGTITTPPGQRTFEQRRPDTHLSHPAHPSTRAARLTHSCTVPSRVLPLLPPLSLVGHRAPHPTTLARTTSSWTKSCPDYTISEAYCLPHPTNDAPVCHSACAHWPPRWCLRCPGRSVPS
jgi:hypothetical protein